MLRAGETRAAAFADYAEPVGVVDHQPGIEAVAERGQLAERRKIAVHRENAFGRDQHARVARAVFRQQCFGMAHVVVTEREHLAPGEARAGPQAGMGNLVDQDEVFRGRPVPE